MSTFSFSDVTAHEILDSRGRPTLRVTVTSEAGTSASASVPSGASTGRREAVELRDGDEARCEGQGVLRAVSLVRGEIKQHICGRHWSCLADVDHALVDLDGTPRRWRLGANAIVGVSMAAARLIAELTRSALWMSLRPSDVTCRLPVPHFNVLNGGAHAHTNQAFQEFMIAPVAADSYQEALRAGAEVYAALRRRLLARGQGIGLGDEGGFAPDLSAPEEALQLLERSIEDAGYPAGLDGVAIALDPAASQFCQDDGTYLVDDHRHSPSELVQRYVDMVREYAVWSIEDGMAEDDENGWRLLTEELGERVQLVGDDLLVTNTGLIEEAAAAGIATAALIKPNQVGTITETLDAVGMCRDVGYGQMISHRSGETNDDFIADLAVAVGCGQLKAGAPARGERVAKYNRLLDIAASNPRMPYGLPDGTLPPHAGK